MSNSEIDAIREKLLVVGAQARDEMSFRQLVALYERRLLYYIHRILGNDRDRSDVLQDVWMRVFLQIGKLRTPEAFRVWLYKIAHDVAVSHLRKSRRHTVLQEGDDDPQLGTNQDWNEFELLDNAQLVHEMLERLSLPHREVLTLRFLEDLDLAEIAQVIGCAVGTVKSRLHHAKAAMRTLLEASGRE